MCGLTIERPDGGTTDIKKSSFLQTAKEAQQRIVYCDLLDTSTSNGSQFFSVVFPYCAEVLLLDTWAAWV